MFTQFKKENKFYNWWSVIFKKPRMFTSASELLSLLARKAVTQKLIKTKSMMFHLKSQHVPRLVVYVYQSCFCLFWLQYETGHFLHQTF